MVKVVLGDETVCVCVCRRKFNCNSAEELSRVLLIGKDTSRQGWMWLSAACSMIQTNPFSEAMLNPAAWLLEDSSFCGLQPLSAEERVVVWKGLDL